MSIENPEQVIASVTWSSAGDMQRTAYGSPNIAYVLREFSGQPVLFSHDVSWSRNVPGANNDGFNRILAALEALQISGVDFVYLHTPETVNDSDLGYIVITDPKSVAKINDICARHAAATPGNILETSGVIKTRVDGPKQG